LGRVAYSRLLKNRKLVGCVPTVLREGKIIGDGDRRCALVGGGVEEAYFLKAVIGGYFRVRPCSRLQGRTLFYLEIGGGNGDVESKVVNVVATVVVWWVGVF